MRIGRMRKLILGGMIMMMALGQMGCGMSNQKAEKIILKKLEEKYGEPFVVAAIGESWGAMNSSTIKGNCYPEADSSRRFQVEINRNTEIVYDKYLNEVVGKNEEENIETLVKQVWEDSIVQVSNDTGMAYPKENNKSMTFREFLELYPNDWQQVDIYIKGKVNVNIEEEMNKYVKLVQLFIHKGYIKTHIGIYYLSEQGYERCNKLIEEVYGVSDYIDINYPNDYYCPIGIRINQDGSIEDNKEQWIKNLEKYNRN